MSWQQIRYLKQKGQTSRNSQTVVKTTVKTNTTRNRKSEEPCKSKKLELVT